MVMQDDADDPLELVLSLNQHTVVFLEKLVGPDALRPEHTRETLAVEWLGRWDRRTDKQLDFHERFGPGTETVTVTVDRPLWRVLRDYGAERRWWPDEVASAVLNDCGARMAWHNLYDTRD